MSWVFVGVIAACCLLNMVLSVVAADDEPVRASCFLGWMLLFAVVVWVQVFILP